MTRLQVEDIETLYQLLHRVRDAHVVWHNCCDIHAQGFAWIGSDMSESFRDLCERARYAGLVQVGLHHAGASAVSLTGAGEARLMELASRRTVRGVA